MRDGRRGCVLEQRTSAAFRSSGSLLSAPVSLVEAALPVVFAVMDAVLDSC